MNSSRLGLQATLPASLLCALASYPHNAHASTRETATLTYSSTASCPDEAAFRRKVARHLGYDPFETEAKRFISVAFAAKGRAIEASARMQRPGKPDSLRTLGDTPEHCDALADAVASGIAMAIDPIQTAALQNAGMLQTPPPPAPAAEATAVVQTAPGAPASTAPRNDATATTRLQLTTDWDSGELVQHLGTSYGTGYVGGRAATVTTFHMQRLCRLPCNVDVATEGTYYVDAPGMHARQVAIPAGALQLDAKVHGAAQAPLVLSLAAVYIGGIAAIAGGIAWGAGVADPTTENVFTTQREWKQVTTPSKYETLVPAVTIAGSSMLIAGIAGLIFFPRTHVEASDGSRLDARATPARSSIGMSPQGFTF